MTVKKTPLYEEHLSLGAHLIEFANTLLPARFAGEKEEHLAVRNEAGCFDVSHMGEFFVWGEDAFSFLQKILSNNLEKISDYKALYSLLLNPQGGIIDDLIVYQYSKEKFMLCVNAANIEKDWAWLNQQKEDFNFNLNLENATEAFAQIALQGPLALKLLAKITNENPPEHFAFKEMTFIKPSCKALVARTGYTGENGVEIFINPKNAATLWRELIKAGAKPCGLAARDSLRLEAGLLLHGNDMNEHITPWQASLGFAVDMNKSFIGHEALQKEDKQSPKQKLFGLRLLDKGIARAGYKIFSSESKEIGTICSGTWLASTESSVALAYLSQPFLKLGDEVLVEIRNRRLKAQVCKPRFLATKKDKK